MSDNNQEYPLPVTLDDQTTRQTARHLPAFFRTDSNKKFLGSTLDPLTQPGKYSRINSYIGRKDVPNFTFDDNYETATNLVRQYYQLEPAFVYEDSVSQEVNWYADYIDYMNSLKYFGANIKNHSKLNKQEAYAWNPYINWDKFVNFREYYWLPQGPDPVTIFGEIEATETTYRVFAVDQVDNVGYVFSLDGLTVNPRITLYRGLKYTFEIDAENKFFAIKTQPQPGDSFYYDQGVSARNIERGILEFEVPFEAPDLLYYLDNNDPNTVGMFDIKDISESASLNVETQILDKRFFTSSNGINFINGLKIKFAGNIEPKIYSDGFWYVEGVGEKIKLVKTDTLQTPAVFGATIELGFDDQPFDSVPFETANDFPLEKDYIVINRSSRDRNTWSRNNRWFHRNVLETVAAANNTIALLDQDNRANRPIIEFDPDLKLFNYGYFSKTDIDLVDTVTTDVFSTIEGSTGYIVDGEQLLPGYKVLFTADTDQLVNGRIFEVKTIFNANKNRTQITLQEIAETDPSNGEVVYVTRGITYKGASFHYENNIWKLAQQKTQVNQHPLFDLFDNNGNSYSDTTFYPFNTFAGNRIFGYKIGTGSQDKNLNFPLSYRNINNVGDIVFEFDLQNTDWQYVENNQLTNINSSEGFVRKWIEDSRFSYGNGWEKTDKLTEQNVVRILKVNSETNVIPIDVYDNSGEIFGYKLRVYVNDKKRTDISIERINEIAYIKFATPLKLNDKVVYKIASYADKNNRGYYEIPLNWQNNPLNQSVETFTFGEVVDHVKSIVESSREFSGEFPGIGNLDNLGSLSKFGRKFMQHTGPMSMSAFLMVDRDANLVKSLRWTAKKYTEFKKEFLRIANDFSFDGTVNEIVDNILLEYSRSRFQDVNPFYFSDMVPYGANTTRNYTVVDFRFPVFVIDSIYNPESQTNRSVLVYLNNQQLLYKRDYIFDQTDAFVQILVPLKNGDVITVKDYESTEGCYVPFTPSKLGLYPLYEPKKYIDDTYREPTLVIQGHDGSIIKAYNDYRDDLLLDLETRIYNTVRIQFDADIFNFYDILPGYYRLNEFTQQEVNDVILSEFLRWNSVSAQDFTTNTYYIENEPFTYNYSNSLDPTQTISLNGYWRGIYKYFYDTDRPHSHPWEMQGFTIKPNWWDVVYGPAPYTSENKILWESIERGIINDPENTRIDDRFVRPGITRYIPVDDQGNLLSPLDSNLAQNFSLISATGNYKFGDIAPVENAWRRSSEYPYALMIVFSVLRGSEFIGKMWDRFTIKRNIAGQIYSTITKNRVSPNSLPFPDKTTTSGLVNFVHEYIFAEKFINQELYQTVLTNLNVKLSHRLGGFTDKSKIKVLLDSRSPNATGTIFLPPENYKVFYNKSAPVDAVSYSGVIIEKVNAGYAIRGYDNTKNYFEIYSPIIQNSDISFNIGGVSETFIDWTADKRYNQGTIVRFNNQFYRSKINHTSENNFDTDKEKWQRLAKLPIVGGRDAIRRSKFNTDIIVRIPYGIVYSTIQEVVDFLLGYQSRLQDVGFEFQDFNKSLNTSLNWFTSAKEFMFWTLQNWSLGSVITLSPAANRLKFSPVINAGIDDIDTDFYEYSIFKSDGTPLKIDFVNVFRDDIGFDIKPKTITNEGIYHLTTNLVYKEHIILFDNVTVFNDVIYDVVPGYRQGRVKLIGFKTSNWNGDFKTPGFLFDDAKVTDWQPNTDYNLGDIVKYKNYYFAAISKISGKPDFDFNDWNQIQNAPTPGLIENFDFRAEKYRDYYSLDSVSCDDGQQCLARHLIGYQNRDYLANIINDDVAQYKFYQGFIKEKGTLNSVEKLFDALRSSGFNSIEIKEEWAIKTGDFGATDAFVEIEFSLDETKVKYNPQNIVLTQNKTEFSDLTTYNITNSEVDIKPVDYDSNPFKTKQLNHDLQNYGLFKYKVAGYVKDEDVEHILYDEIALLNYNIDILRENDKLWVGNTQNGDWNVYEFYNTEILIVDWSIEENIISLSCSDVPVNIKKDDIIAIKNLDILDGIYKVQRVYNNIIEIFTLNGVVFKLEDESTAGILFKIEPVRFKTVLDVNTKKYNKLKIRGQKLWIDRDSNDNWLVLENQDAFTEDKISASVLKQQDQQFGYDISISDNNLVMFVSAPNNQSGKVLVYSRPNIQSNWVFMQTIECPVNFATITGSEKFGHSISSSDDGMLVAISAPYTSNVKSDFKGDFDLFASYNIGDIVRYNQKLWKNINPVTGDGSTITIETQDWELVDFYQSSTDKTPSGLVNQGIVYIYAYDNIRQRYSLHTAILSYDPVSNEKFGSTVKIKYDGTNIWLFVSSKHHNNDTGRVQILKIHNFKNVSRWIQNVSYEIGTVIQHGQYQYECVQSHISDVLLNRPDLDTFQQFWKQISWVFNEQVFLDFTNIIGTYPSIYFPNSGSMYGYSVDIDNGVNTAVVSAPFLESGAVYVFKRINNIFNLVQVIDSYTIENNIVENLVGTSAYLRPNDGFGYSVKITNTSLLVSCPNDDTGGDNLGSVYYFDDIQDNSSINVFRIKQIIIPPSNIDNERFGTTISVSANKKLLVVSAVNGNSVLDTTFDGYVDRLVFNADSTSNYVLDSSSPVRISTTFDIGATTFFDKTPYTGAVYAYNLFDDLYIFADKLRPVEDLNSDDNFGFSTFTTDDTIVVGTPNHSIDNNRYGILFTFDYSDLSWKTKESCKELIDIDKFKKSFIYDSKNNVLVDNLDFYDPAKGKIPGIVEQELKYQTYYDPAIYEFGIDGEVSIDQTTPWTDAHVGELWWDLSKVKYVWYEQGDSSYRNNNWGRLFPGSSVDIYEWVETIYLPSRWAELADTEEGIALGISGVPKNIDNFTYSTKFKYDPISGITTTLYYYWVRTKTTVPRKSFRTFSAADLTRLILDPKSQGYRFVSIMDKNSIAVNNIAPLLNDNDLSLNIRFYNIDRSDLLVHREFALLAENDANTLIPNIVETKWFDSLVGFDNKGRLVPDQRLSVKLKYGILNSPRQSMFVNRMEALKQFIEYTNSVLIKNQITDRINFSNLMLQELQPTIESGKIDQIIDINDELRFIGTSKLKTAELSLSIVDGKISTVFVTNPGFGYKTSPTIVIAGTGTGAELKAEIDNLGRISRVNVIKSGSRYDDNTKLTVRGFSVLVRSDSDANNGWSIQEWNPNKKRWTKVKSQSFNVTKYWNYADWYATGYNATTEIDYLINSSYELPKVPAKINDIVKISNIGSNEWTLLRRKALTNDPDYLVDYEIIGKQNATIQFSTKLYNLNSELGFDARFGFDVGGYDKFPSVELKIILQAIRDDIFINDLKIEYINLFFNSLHYVLTEQPYIDWAFKTSFLKINHDAGELTQKPTFQSDSLDSYQKYIEETKPYKSKIRELVDSYKSLDLSYQQTTDFDLPSYYNLETNSIESVNLLSDKLTQYPWKNWADNYKFELIDIVILDQGDNYTSVPKVIISGGGGSGAKATAFIAKGKVYKIVIDDPGKNYVSTPNVYISGGNGDNEQKRAKAYARIGNSKVRSIKTSIKYDRVSPVYETTDFTVNEIFVGQTNKTEFALKYAPEIQKSKFTITVDNIEIYGSQFDVVISETLHDTYTTINGKVVFKNAPPVNANISITYYKNIKLYSASDRINYAYDPTTGQYGKELSILMNGVDYGGVRLDSIDFDIGSGWDVLPWDVAPWDNVSKTNDDFAIISDGTTRSFTLPYIPKDQEVINVYVNNKRIDDLYYDLYDGSTVQPNGLITAPDGTFMNSFVGDGINNVIAIPEPVDLFVDDIIVFRKSTSDGTLLVTDKSLIDAFVSGGDLTYTSAQGILPEEIIVDGDNLITADTSYGPEELLQGQLVDTLKIDVYNAPSPGGPNVYTKNYTSDGTTIEFDLGIIPPTIDSIFAIVDNNLVNYTVNYTNNTVILDQIPPVDSKITFIILDIAGYDILDKTVFIGDGSTREFLTSAQYYNGNVTVFASVNGIVSNITIKESDDSYDAVGNTVVVFDTVPVSNTIIQIMVFAGNIQKWSDINTQTIAVAPGQFTYTLNPAPGVETPFGSNVFVAVDGEFLKSPDYSYYTYTGIDLILDSTKYPSSSLNPQSINLYHRGIMLTPVQDYTVDFVLNTIKISTTNVSLNDEIIVEITKNAEFTVANSTLVISSANYSLVNAQEIKVTTFTNHDILKVKNSTTGFNFINVGYDAVNYDVVLYDSLSTAINAGGIFDLPRTVSASSAVFVILNKKILAPNVDYVVLDNLRQIKVILPNVLTNQDYIQIVTFNDKTVKSSFAFTIFKDMLNRYHYKRINSSVNTILAKDLHYYSTEITVEDASKLSEPNKNNNIPGVIEINNERIEYFEKFGNTLKVIRRGTLGTGIAQIHTVGSTVRDFGISQTVPYTDNEVKDVIYADGSSLLYQLNFVPSVNTNTLQNWYKDTIPNGFGQCDQIEVFVAGRRLRKTPITVYDQLLGQDSYNGFGNKTIEAEYSVNGIDPVIRFTYAPNPGDMIVIVYKTGKLWQNLDENDSFVYSNTGIAKFITSKSTPLPK
jgi:hypothetical protein